MLLVLASLLAGCSDDGPDSTRSTTTTAPDDGPPAADEVGPFPVLAGSATSDGELTSGLPIVEGSTLMCPTFPDVADDPGGFEAV